MTITITWSTQSGTIGTYPANVNMQFYVEATANVGSITSYQLISGSLPAGLSFATDGEISGTPDTVKQDTISTFVVRATATHLTNTAISDRTFTMTISGTAAPYFTTPAGLILTTDDSLWVEQAITYTNPITSNPISIRVSQGTLPPGLEINSFGLIRGYASPPVIENDYNNVSTIAISTAVTNYITVLSTSEFAVSRPVIFTGTTFGNIVNGTIYYVKEIISASEFSITTVPNGSAFELIASTGVMNVNLPDTTVGEPTKLQYTFTVELNSPNGIDRETYTIVVKNQNLPVSQGGSGIVFGTRIPAIYNTRPPTYNIESDSENFGYYVLPPDDTVSIPGTTYDPTANAYIGQFLSDNFFSFRILGHDFDNITLTYNFTGMPGWLSYDSSTGWIYGDPTVSLDNITEFSFSVNVSKVLGGTTYSSATFDFSFRVANNITGDIIWLTDSDLGTLVDSTICTKVITATSDTDLVYSLDSGTLPYNIELSSNGELQGIVAYQPNDTFTPDGDTTVYTFTVLAESTDPTLAPIINSTKTFTLNVVQELNDPTDNVYITCTPDVQDRVILETLLTNANLIPSQYLYRSTDINFGKASNINFTLAYGIDSNNVEEYITATQKNFYNKSLTLGQLNTAIARDENGNIQYEVVYCNIIDDLLKYQKSAGADYRYSVSIPIELLQFWPRFINLNLGPWYTSVTNIYTSYELVINSLPTYYTSLTPGFARLLYPNSIDNMRERLEEDLGYNNDYRKLPLWMTSQQRDGRTLGYTPAWVIAYTKPSPVIEVLATQTINSLDCVILSDVSDINVGGRIVFTGSTFGNINSNTTYYVLDVGVPGYSNGVVLSTAPNGPAVSLFDETGTMNATFFMGSYAEIIKDNIENDWNYKLNDIDFKIDRVSVDKELTYDFDPITQTWAEYPSATPVPDPTNSEDFYVLFPETTILPPETQYNL